MTNPPTPQMPKPCYLCDGDEMVTVYSETGEYDIDCPACSPEYQEKADRVEELEKALREIEQMLEHRKALKKNTNADQLLLANISVTVDQALTNPGEKGNAS